MKKYVIITGGELFNKGAQAMTFSIINEVKKRNPDIICVLLSTKDALERTEKEKKTYNFEILPYKFFDILVGTKSIFQLLKFIKRNENDYIKRITYILDNCIMMIDVSGYVLSSAWGRKRCQSFLMKIWVAKKYAIPVYIMPQSFGPLNFKGIDRLIINFMIKHILSYPQIVYAREESGYELLTKSYNLKNVKKSLDTVLICGKIEEENIYINQVIKPQIVLKQNAVGILPNQRTLEHGNETQILELYSKIIENLAHEKIVYLVNHSEDDIEFCEKLKKQFAQNQKVVLLKQEFSCIDFEQLVGAFDYLIASRYHSVVHAYKQCVPCIILGWADKYKELAAFYDQKEYVFDISDKFLDSDILNAINMMNRNYINEKKIIGERSKAIKKLNEFNFFEKLEVIQ